MRNYLFSTPNLFTALAHPVCGKKMGEPNGNGNLSETSKVLARLPHPYEMSP